VENPFFEIHSCRLDIANNESGSGEEEVLTFYAEETYSEGFTTFARGCIILGLRDTRAATLESNLATFKDTLSPSHIKINLEKWFLGFPYVKVCLRRF